MKAHYDPDTDALALNWSSTDIEESDEVEPGVILDYDSNGNVIGVEVSKASKKIRQLSGIPLLVEPIAKP